MKEIDVLKLEKEAVERERGRVKLAEYRIEEIRELFNTGKILEEFDEKIFKNMVKQIKVIGRYDVEIEFNCGIKVYETVK